MFKYLKKDPNRHFTFNVGVTCFRFMAVLFLLGLLVALSGQVSKPYQLKPEGEVSFTILKLEDHKYKTYGRRTRTHHLYSLTCCETESGASHNQTITKAEYLSLKEGETYVRPMYKTRQGHFISWGGITSAAKATEEYYDRFPTAGMIFRKWAVIVLLGLAGIMFIIGIGEFRIADKNDALKAAATPMQQDNVKQTVSDAEIEAIFGSGSKGNGGNQNVCR